MAHTVNDLPPTDHMPAEARPGWYFVTCRAAGDDEDSGYIVEATDPADASAKADAMLRENSGLPAAPADDADEDVETYTNYVIFCGAEKPAVIWCPDWTITNSKPAPEGAPTNG